MKLRIFSKTPRFLRTLATAILSLVFAGAAGAATITVVNTDSSGVGSLNQALLDATDGDTINFNLTGCPCVIAGGLSTTKSLSIEGPGPSVLTLDAMNSGVVYAPSAGPRSFTISGFTIINGLGNLGGAVRVLGASVAPSIATTTIRNVVFRNNSATVSNQGSGGAVYLSAGTLNVVDCVFENNKASFVGGAIAGPTTVDPNSPPVINIINSTFNDNRVTLTGGGGAINVRAGTVLTIKNSTFNRNSGTTAGAIANFGELAIEGGSFVGNQATNGDGGGIFCGAGSSTKLTSVNMTGQTTPENARGGSIYTEGALIFENGSITNSSGGTGGGIYSTADLTVIDSNINDNTALSDTTAIDGGGGGIHSEGSLKITGSSISRNSAVGTGGGIYTEGPFSMVNSTVSGNQVTAGRVLDGVGGGIHFGSNTNGSIRSSTISFNAAVLSGGGLSKTVANTTVRVASTIVAKNTIGGAASNPLRQIDGIYLSQGYNLISTASTSSGFRVGLANDLISSSTASAIEPLLGPLANNGGPTLTHELRPGSPAIDRGYCTTGIFTDQRRSTRFVDVPASANYPGSGNADIGAFELSVPTAAAVSVRGRVVTFEKRGLTNAKVILINTHGDVVSTSTTSTFGNFNLPNSNVGETYVLIVRSKSYRFTPVVFTLADELTDVQIAADAPAKSRGK